MATRRTTTTTEEPSKTTTPTTVATSTPAADVEAPEASLVHVVKKKELIERVSEASGIKKGIAKKVIEATLKEMGDIMQEGTEMNLPPLGKVSINRQKEVANAFILIAKLRRAKGMLASKSPAGEGEVASGEDVDTTESE
ncbi:MULTISPECIES: HU family DNA-binding protein [Pacificibacter]|uniref:HU family DNA-binding protein n=1 Tax=Pacificibacter TaxID=1042323 RepID=UPI001C082C47|nr:MULTISPECIES: HU family DNA-binding protein [Pacificibacter]MBU2936280.1 HU family DNA-binding protein [Pacificibacter marinus]MDO6616750.1 HU family DNA-binding protein [Pacificibacter sp. 1_MG-2023]